jgi:hypothetical protein
MHTYLARVEAFYGAYEALAIKATDNVDAAPYTRRAKACAPEEHRGREAPLSTRGIQPPDCVQRRPDTLLCRHRR